jgi:hypothetical protein
MPSSRRQHDSIVIKRQVEVISRLNTDLGKDRLGDDYYGGIAHLSNHRFHYRTLASVITILLQAGHEISMRRDRMGVPGSRTSLPPIGPPSAARAEMGIPR